MKPKERKRGRTERQRRRSTPPPALTGATQLESGNGASRAEVLAGLLKLTPEQLEVVVWYFHDGVGMPEIAGWLGCTKQAVEDRIKRIEARIAKAGLPPPRRVEHPYAQDHVPPTNLIHKREHRS